METPRSAREWVGGPGVRPRQPARFDHNQSDKSANQQLQPPDDVDARGKPDDRRAHSLRKDEAQERVIGQLVGDEAAESGLLAKRREGREARR